MPEIPLPYLEPCPCRACPELPSLPPQSFSANPEATHDALATTSATLHHVLGMPFPPSLYGPADAVEAVVRTASQMSTMATYRR